MPRWHPISISGYHIREAGSTAQQELAFTLKDGFTYVEQAIERGLDVDDFAPRLSFFFNAHIDFFEEIAKYRAARRIWARELRDTFGAKDERSLLMRTHAQTAGVSLTAQQPLNNIVRTATEALAAVLGGTQSLHTNSYDEALALPTEDAVRVALRTQQVIAHETGVTNTIDPLGGSYFVEALTDRMEEAAYGYFRRIDELGGMVEAIKQNYPQREIADASFRYQEEVDAGKRIVVGVNRYQHATTHELDDPADRPGARAQADRPPPGRPRTPRRPRPWSARSAALKQSAAGRREPDGAAARLRARPRERGRDHRVAAGGLRHLHRDAGLLAAFEPSDAGVRMPVREPITQGVPLRKPLATIALIVVLAALAVAGSAVASQSSPEVQASATKVAKVRDNFFSARTCKTVKGWLTCTISKNDIMEWRWTPDPGFTETNEHNVTGFYKGDVAFASKDMTSTKYRKKFRSAGRTYKVLCTLHASNMRMKVVVRR